MYFINTLFTTVGEINLLDGRSRTDTSKNTDKCYKCSRCNSNFKYSSNCNEHEYCWHYTKKT